MILSEIMIASFWTSDWVVKISQFVRDHQVAIMIPIFAAIAGGTIVPRSWETWSARYVKSHQRLLWALVVFLFALILVAAYLILKLT